ncbi:MAG: M42 family metallopeptidase [Planctomycetes bacterium]|nr:M42 family metallopeptidase [Planctomycetota bacterium]
MKSTIRKNDFLALLKKFLLTHAPGGQEEEMDEIVRPELEKLCDEVWKDDFGNVVGFVKGGNDTPMAVTAHKDEVAMIVKRIEEDGRLRVDSMGGAYSWKYGEGPVHVLGRRKMIDAVLSVGCAHTSAETSSMQRARSAPLPWDALRIDAKMKKDDLKKAGVGPGTRVVVHRSRKEPMQVGDCICGWGLDDKGSVAIMITALREFRKRDLRPNSDIYFGATAFEEGGAAAGSYLAREHKIGALIALEIGPAEKEYDTSNCEKPVVLYRDSGHLYDKDLADEFCDIAGDLGFGAQPATVTSFGSEASYAKKYGQVGRAGCIGFPTQNSHGYEMSNIKGMLNSVRLLAEYLVRHST